MTTRGTDRPIETPVQIAERRLRDAEQHPDKTKPIMVESIVGSRCVRVLSAPHEFPARGDYAYALPVWYGPMGNDLARRAPRAGDVLDTYMDVSTLYAIAPAR